MKRQTKVDKISHNIYEYLKDWLNPQGTMVPGYVYNKIREITEKHLNPPKKLLKKKLVDKPIDKQTQGWVDVIRNSNKQSF